MKKMIFFFVALLGGQWPTTSQTLVFNDKLLAQLTKNQAARLGSNESFLSSYEKQKKLYNDINKKIAQIVAIQQFIYDKLTNVSAAIRQGKQLYYLSNTFVQIGENANDVLGLTAQHPEYAVLMNRFYIAAMQELLKLQSELTQDILREENDFLMDPFDRQVLIQNISTKAQMINGYLVCIKIRLKNAKKIPYIYQIPTVNTYVNLDKMIVKGILEKYQYLFN